jgi:predicted translin family RNA/ssDNA-binding protein
VEYFLGSIITLIITSVINKRFNRIIDKQKSIRPKIGQSYLHKILAEFENLKNEEKINTQSSKYVEERYVKIMIVEDQAFWIKDNGLYSATLINGEIDNSTTKLVDTMSMDAVELKKTMFVVEKLTEGKVDDSGSTGK